MTVSSARGLAGVPNALRETGAFAARLAVSHPAVCLAYDGTLTPIVDRPEGANFERMREVVRVLAHRCSVWVVSDRDRARVQRLMGMDDLVVAGSHGSHLELRRGRDRARGGRGFWDLPGRIAGTVWARIASVPGVLVATKKSWVAVHYRPVDEDHRPRVRAIVDPVLAAEPHALHVTPGKMVYEIQPRLECGKGRAVPYPLEAPGPDRDDVLALYVGDDANDEDASQALGGRCGGCVVADPSDPDIAGRSTAAAYVLSDSRQVERFLGGVTR